MNLTEQSIIAAIVIVISVATWGLYTKASASADELTQMLVATPEHEGNPVMAEIARLEAERAELIASKQGR